LTHLSFCQSLYYDSQGQKVDNEFRFALVYGKKPINNGLEARKLKIRIQQTMVSQTHYEKYTIQFLIQMEYDGSK